MPFDLLRAASDLIGADTVSSRGNLALVPILRGLCNEVGLSLEISEHAAAGARHANFLMSLPGSSGREPLLLVTHTDTVPAGPLDRWTETPPHVARVAGDRLYGLGSADVKADLCAKLLAAERWRGRPLRRDFFVLGTFGEEIGLLGAKAFVGSGRLTPRFVVCGEPSDLTIIHAHKGYLVARVRLGRPARPSASAGRTLRFEGRAAHSSSPSRGENAIEKALVHDLHGAVALRGGQGANSVPALCEVELGTREGNLPLGALRQAISRWHFVLAMLAPAKDPRFDPATAVSNVGFVQAADGEVELLLDARLLPGHDPAAVERAFEAEIAALAGSVSFERENPAVWTDPEGELCRAAVRASSALGLSTEPRTKATNTEAAAFAGLCDAIVFGPGTSAGNAHCPNEHTSLAQLRTAIDWYERLIGELCGA